MKEKTALSQKQSEVLEFIKSFVSSKGYPPSVREISEHMNYASSSTAFNIIERLVLKGYITKGNGPRMITVLEKK